MECFDHPKNATIYITKKINSAVTYSEKSTSTSYKPLNFYDTQKQKITKTPGFQRSFGEKINLTPNFLKGREGGGVLLRAFFGCTHGISLKFTSFASFSAYCPGPLNMALIVPEVRACSLLTTNVCPSEDMSLTYCELGPSTPPYWEESSAPAGPFALLSSVITLSKMRYKLQSWAPEKKIIMKIASSDAFLAVRYFKVKHVRKYWGSKASVRIDW